MLDYARFLLTYLPPSSLGDLFMLHFRPEEVHSRKCIELIHENAWSYFSSPIQFLRHLLVALSWYCRRI